MSKSVGDFDTFQKRVDAIMHHRLSERLNALMQTLPPDMLETMPPDGVVHDSDERLLTDQRIERLHAATRSSKTSARSSSGVPKAELSSFSAVALPSMSRAAARRDVRINRTAYADRSPREAT